MRDPWKDTRPGTWGLRILGVLAVEVVFSLFVGHPSAAGVPPVASPGNPIVDALREPGLLSVRADSSAADDWRLALDGRDDTSWRGRAGEGTWQWTAAFSRPIHLGLLRAHFGDSPTSGVPTKFRWDVLSAGRDRVTCSALSTASLTGREWIPLAGAEQGAGRAEQDTAAQPTHRSWFVDADACALRIVIDRTNAGPPVLREVRAIESARNVLRDGRATGDPTYPGFEAASVIDGTYARRWAGSPGAREHRWTLRVDLRDPQPIDRVRLVLGFDATSVPRGSTGRSYAMAWAPVRYSVETSADGVRFVPLAAEPRRSDGSILPLRRRLVALAEPREVRALRLVMTGATGPSGAPEPDAVPVVREMAAYRADDRRPILAAPWFLSINANPSAQAREIPGGELADDGYHARLLRTRFAQVLPPLEQDDHYAGPPGAYPGDRAGKALESIEGDDPQLDAQFLAQSSPPPIAVLSGSNDWDYDTETGPDPAFARRWHWDPLRDPNVGGMGQLAPAVRHRVAPFLGFCGGAQILALLEARRSDSSTDEERRTIDRVLWRNSGRPIRGFASPTDVERAWPDDPRTRRSRIEFLPGDPLFVDIAGSSRRSVTRAMPESHADAVRPDAFLPGAPLDHFDVLATSTFCVPVAVASAQDGELAASAGPGACDTVPQVFRSRDPAWPVIGVQFHPEQRGFTVAAPDDPAESTADPLLFLAAAYEQIVDAYERFAP